MATDEQIGAEEARRLLGISAATYHRWLRDGRLPGQKVGGRWRFRRRTIEAMLRPNVSVDADVAAAIDSYRAAMGPAAPEPFDNSEGAWGSADLAPARYLLDLVVTRAAMDQATDIHIDHGRRALSVTTRIDGTVIPGPVTMSTGVHGPLLAAVKDRAGLDAFVEGRAQTGHFRVREGLDIAVTTYPTLLGETVTMRVIDLDRVAPHLVDLGIAPATHRRLMDAITSRQHGAVIVTGATGSGKTTTLLSLLREVQGPGLRIMTAEDALWTHFDGVVQAAVTPDFTFEDAMRAMLQSDLDIGVVAELGSKEAMGLFFHLARTGHLMLACMHEAEAVTALQSLLRVGGLEPHLLASQILAILGQRLVRVSCPDCRGSRTPTAVEADALGLRGADRRRKYATNEGSAGCATCGGKGGRERIAVHELIAITPAVVEAMTGGGSLADAVGAEFPTWRDELHAHLDAGTVSIEAAVAAAI